MNSNSFLGEKENIEPFKITIDTHTIQKDGQPPETKTVATLHNLGALTNMSTVDNAPMAESRYDCPSTPYSVF